MNDHAADATIATVANKIAYGGGGVALWGGMTANEIAAYAGVLIAALGLLVQLYYKRKSDKREAEEHSVRMAVLRRGADDGG